MTNNVRNLDKMVFSKIFTLNICFWSDHTGKQKYYGAFSYKLHMSLECDGYLRNSPTKSHVFRQFLSYRLVTGIQAALPTHLLEAYSDFPNGS